MALVRKRRIVSMYIQFKHGFIEADRWDESPVPVRLHQEAIETARGQDDHGVIVVRARERQTLEWVASQIPDRHVAILRSPPDWDYRWRCYLSVEEWSDVLSYVAIGINYRNFKASTNGQSVGREQLAHDIWRVALDALGK